MTTYNGGRRKTVRRLGVFLATLAGVGTMLVTSAAPAPASVLDLYCSYSSNLCVFQDQNQPSGGNQNEWGRNFWDGTFTDDHWAGTFDVLNDEASSAHNYTNCTAFLHHDSNYGGSSFTLQGGFGYNSFGSFDNEASSLSWSGC